MADDVAVSATPSSSVTESKPVPSVLQPQHAEAKPQAPEGEAVDTPDPRFAKQFGALARERKRLDAERNAAKQELNSHREEMRQLNEWRELQKLKETDPTAFFERTGLSFDGLVNHYLTKDVPPTESARLDRIEKEIKAYEDGLKRQKAEAQKAEIDRGVREHKANIRAFIQESPEKFELIEAHEAHDDVFALIEARYLKTFDRSTGRGEILSMERAASLVEDQLFEEAKRIAKAKKMGALFNPPAEGKAGDEDSSLKREALRPTEKLAGSGVTRVLTNQSVQSRAIVADQAASRDALLEAVAQKLKQQNGR